MSTTRFSFEELTVWEKSVEFCEKIIDLTENIQSDRKHYRLIEQLESAAASIAQNIAEGKGRYSKKEFVNFLYISRGSLFEAVTLLIIFHRRKWINNTQLEFMKGFGGEIGRMISGLISVIKRSTNN